MIPSWLVDSAIRSWAKSLDETWAQSWFPARDVYLSDAFAGALTDWRVVGVAVDEPLFSLLPTVDVGDAQRVRLDWPPSTDTL
jgi:hypothetical protein